MYYFQFCLLVLPLNLNFKCTLCISPAEAGCGGVYEARHDPGDGSQLKGLQTKQAADVEGSAHD